MTSSLERQSCNPTQGATAGELPNLPIGMFGKYTASWASLLGKGNRVTGNKVYAILLLLKLMPSHSFSADPPLSSL